MKTYLKQSINLFKIYIVGLCLFACFRLAYLLRFGEGGLVSNYTSEIIFSFFTGIKFDTQILCYSFALLFIINFLFFFNNNLLTNTILRFSKIYAIAILSVIALLLIIDHQYYTYFQSHLNVLVYGFIEDDTSAVLVSMWSDHPVLRVIILYFIIVFLLYKVISRIYSSKPKLINSPKVYISVLGIMLFAGCFFLGVRGSISNRPLKIEDASISDNRFINTLTLNGVYTLEKAIEEQNETRKPTYKKQLLKDKKYSSIQEVLADYYGKDVTEFQSNNYLDYLFETTQKDSLLENAPPNIVFILMESFGGYYLNFHSQEMNLLGSFESHLQEDILFTNFLSSTQGTIFSLENILINKEYPPVSKTKRRFESFNSSIAFPYMNAGYETTFITGGKIGWRNLHEFLPNQYFKEVYGQEKIRKNNPKATKNTWGVHDEFLLNEIFNKLNDNNPQLICALTTTNHTPYEIPKTYKPYPLTIPDSIKNLIISNNDIAELNFRAYQYANDCLGNFLTKLKASKYGNNTIVAVTGDHNSYALFPFNNSKIKEEHNHIVPLYIYVPEKYKKKLIINEKRYASHKDIFPTLFNISLSNQKYFSLGNNLFSDNPDSLFYGINEHFYYGHPSLTKATLDKRVRAKSILSEYYFALP